MNMLDRSVGLIQKCCYSYVAETLGHASEALKTENISRDNVTIKANNKAISTLKNQYQNEAKILGNSLDKLSIAIKTFIKTGEKEIEPKELNEMELKIYSSMVEELLKSNEKEKNKFNKDFESFVNSYNSEVLKKVNAPRRVTQSLNLDISLYKKGLQFLADKDQTDKISNRFNKGGDLRDRFDERLERLTKDEDRLPHFEKDLTLKDQKRLEKFLKEFGVLNKEEEKTLKQAFLDFPQIRDDTLRFSGELFTIPRKFEEFRQMTIPSERLHQVTLLSPQNRARELTEILKIGELFTSPQCPLINVLSLKAERMLKQEILMHLMLDRGVRDEDFKVYGEAIYERILLLDPNLIDNTEKRRENVEKTAKEMLQKIEFTSVDQLEEFCKEILKLEGGSEDIDQALQGLDREMFVKNLRHGEAKSSLQEALAMRLADFAARKLMKESVNVLINKKEINEIENLPPPIPVMRIEERRVFTVNGGAASGKSSTTRLMLGGDGENLEGMPIREHIVTITRDSLMTSLLDPESLLQKDKDYYACFAFDEAVLIANDVERTRIEREKITGKGPHLFYDQVFPDIKKYEIGLKSGGMDGVVVNMPVEISVLLAQLRGEKEKRYAGRWCVLMTHKNQVECQRKVVEYLTKLQTEGNSLEHVHTKINTNVDKDLDSYPTVNFDVFLKIMDVNSAGYFFDFLRKASINLEAETLGDLYLEMSDIEYAKHFMSFAIQFDEVKLKILTKDLNEEVIVFTNQDYEKLEKSLETGECSASVQRLRQNQLKSLSNAEAFIVKAKTALNKQDKKSVEKFLDQAENQINVYLKDYGHKQDDIGIAGNKKAAEYLENIKQLRSKLL